MATHPSETYARNQVINSEQGQKAAAENREPREYKHMLKKQSTPPELVSDTNKQYRFGIEEDGSEEDPELAQHGKRKQRVVYSASTDSDDERSTSKKSNAMNVSPSQLAELKFFFPSSTQLLRVTLPNCI